jgi:Spy/CpxP family protein refolding chaperone
MSAARPPWKHPRVVVTLLLVFLAGAATGALTMRYRMGERMNERLNRTVSAATKEASRDAVIQNFKTQLDLTSEQAMQIAAFLDDYRHYYESLEDQLEDLRATGKRNILSILNPQQREKFEKMMEELAPQLQSGKK